MPRKKVVRQPIEKLKDEAIVIEDSSSDEEEIADIVAGVSADDGSIAEKSLHIYTHF